MGVNGWYRVLRDEGYVPGSSPCCSASLWRPPAQDVLEDNIGSRLEHIPKHSELLIDGNGLAFHWYRIAYARHVATVTKRNRRKESCCVTLRKNNLTPTQVRRLLPNFMPLNQLSAVVHEFITTLRDKHHMKISVYWDGDKRRVYKRETDNRRQERMPEEWNNLRDYCETGTLPPSATVCGWESIFPKNRLFRIQILHTLESLQIPSVLCEDEADAWIAKAARGNPSAYVVGLDSDFCFFPDIQYIPINTLDASGKVANGVVIRRRVLADTLGLPCEKLMTELAILLGNDYVHPGEAEFDVRGGKNVADILQFLQAQNSSFRVTSTCENVEEILRFVRCLYELEDLDDYPFDESDDEDEAGDEVVHLVSSPEALQTSGRFAIPTDVPLDLCKVDPFQDTSAKDAVLRCLEAYLDKNPENSMVTREHLDVFRKLPLDSSMAQLVQHGDWRPTWADFAASYLIEKLLFLVCEKRSLVARLLPPFTVFNQHKFHALLRNERTAKDDTSKLSRGVMPSSESNGLNEQLSRNKTSKKELVELPIDEHEERILASIKKNRVTIIQGETGCGK